MPDLISYDVRNLARLSAVFILSFAAATYVEIALWKLEALLAFAVPFVVYMLASLRFIPWRTPIRKALSCGVLLGMFAPLILYTFGYSF